MYVSNHSEDKAVVITLRPVEDPHHESSLWPQTTYPTLLHFSTYKGHPVDIFTSGFRTRISRFHPWCFKSVILRGDGAAVYSSDGEKHGRRKNRKHNSKTRCLGDPFSHLPLLCSHAPLLSRSVIVMAPLRETTRVFQRFEGSGMSQMFPFFGRGYHESSPFRGHI